MSEVKTYTLKQENFFNLPVFLDRVRLILIPLITLVVDYVAVLGGVWTAYFVRASILPLFFPIFDVPSVYIYTVIPISFVFFLHFDRQYFRQLPFWQQTEKLFKVSIYAMLLIVAIMYFSGAGKEISRLFMLLTWFFSFSYLVGSRYALKQVFNRMKVMQVPVVIIGAGKTAELLIKSFRRESGLGYKIVGFIEDNPQVLSTCKDIPVIGRFSQAEEVVKKYAVRNVLIAAPGLTREKLIDIVYRLQPHVDNITFVPDLFGVPVSGMELRTLFYEKAVLLKVRNNLAQEYNRVMKILFDLFCSITGLIIILPVLFMIGFFIYLDSPGSVIFSHKRIGRNGEMFYCYKFRTMVADSQCVLEKYLMDNPIACEEWKKDFKLKDDPRITKVGKFLRKTSLDELPQIINVLKGEMSLVGPRPIVQAEISKYESYINDYYLVRPGITGMWQVSGRNDVDYPERVQMDSWYVRNWSLWLDIMIIVKTVKVVLMRKGAY